MKLRNGKIVRPGAKPYVPTPSTNIKEFTPQFFKEASEAWKQNKVSLGNGTYKYKKFAWSLREDAPYDFRLDDVLFAVKDSSRVEVNPRRSNRLVKKEESEQTLRRSPRLAEKST